MPDLPMDSVESTSAAEIAALRKSNAELLARHARDKSRLNEFETNTAALTTKATEAETRIKSLTIDGPVDELCADISVAPQALRTALESEYRIEMKDGKLSLFNPSDGKPIMHEGKLVAFTADSIKNLLLASKDESKLKLYRAILVSSKASGAAQPSAHRNTPVPARAQFGLGMSPK